MLGSPTAINSCALPWQWQKAVKNCSHWFSLSSSLFPQIFLTVTTMLQFFLLSSSYHSMTPVIGQCGVKNGSVIIRVGHHYPRQYTPVWKYHILYPLQYYHFRISHFTVHLQLFHGGLLSSRWHDMLHVNVKTSPDLDVSQLTKLVPGACIWHDFTISLAMTLVLCCPYHAHIMRHLFICVYSFQYLGKL